MTNMTVINLGNENDDYLDLLGRDCKPLQYLREMNQNAFDIHKIAGKTKYKKKVNWSVVECKGVPKLAVSDNAQGMTAEEANLYLSSLGRAGRANGINFGVGARTSALSRNRHGILYLCKDKDGREHAILLRHNKRKRNYGCYPMSFKKGVAMLDKTPALKRELAMIRESGHGTIVILMGNSAGENTAEWSGDASKKTRAKGAHWVTYELNSRYYEVPKDVVVTVYPYKSEEAGYKKYEKVKGQGFIMKKPSTCNSTYIACQGRRRYTDSLTGRKATCVWGIMNKSKPDSHGSSYDISGGSIVVDEGGIEVYSERRGKEWSVAAKKYKIFHNSQEIILQFFFEDVVPDASRAGLRDKESGEPIDLDLFADAFCKNIPRKILQHQRKASGVRDVSNKYTRDSKAMDRITNIIDSYQLDLSFKADLNGKGSPSFGKRTQNAPPEKEGNGGTIEGKGKLRKTKFKGNKASANRKSAKRASIRGYVDPEFSFGISEEEDFSFAAYSSAGDHPTGTFIVNENHKIWQTWVEKVEKKYINATLDDINAVIERYVKCILCELFVFAFNKHRGDAKGRAVLDLISKDVLTDEFLENTFGFQAKLHEEGIRKRLSTGSKTRRR